MFAFASSGAYRKPVGVAPTALQNLDFRQLAGAAFQFEVVPNMRASP